jgi:hypothetical protein
LIATLPGHLFPGPGIIAVEAVSPSTVFAAPAVMESAVAAAELFKNDLLEIDIILSLLTVNDLMTIVFSLFSVHHII